MIVGHLLQMVIFLCISFDHLSVRSLIIQESCFCFNQLFLFAIFLGVPKNIAVFLYLFVYLQTLDRTFSFQ